MMKQLWSRFENSRILLTKAGRILRERPSHFFSNLRCYLLFTLTMFLLRFRIGISPRITLGENVRIQRLRSLLAEAPDAFLSIGENSIIYEDSRIEAYGQGNIVIGNDSILGGARISSRAKVSIGHRFLASWNVFIQDFESHPVDAQQRRIQMENMTLNFHPRKARINLRVPQTLDWVPTTSPIEIGDDVWVGANVSILRGAKIGSGSVIATGSVVLRGDYPEYSLLAGNPAVLVKSLLPTVKS